MLPNPPRPRAPPSPPRPQVRRPRPPRRQRRIPLRDIIQISSTIRPLRPPRSQQFRRNFPQPGCPHQIITTTSIRRLRSFVGAPPMSLPPYPLSMEWSDPVQLRPRRPCPRKRRRPTTRRLSSMKRSKKRPLIKRRPRTVQIMTTIW